MNEQQLSAEKDLKRFREWCDRWQYCLQIVNYSTDVILLHPLTAFRYSVQSNFSAGNYHLMPWKVLSTLINVAYYQGILSIWHGCIGRTFLHAMSFMTENLVAEFFHLPIDFSFEEGLYYLLDHLQLKFIIQLIFTAFYSCNTIQCIQSAHVLDTGVINLVSDGFRRLFGRFYTSNVITNLFPFLSKLIGSESDSSKNNQLWSKAVVKNSASLHPSYKSSYNNKLNKRRTSISNDMDGLFYNKSLQFHNGNDGWRKKKYRIPFNSNIEKRLSTNGNDREMTKRINESINSKYHSFSDGRIINIYYLLVPSAILFTSQHMIRSTLQIPFESIHRWWLKLQRQRHSYISVYKELEDRAFGFDDDPPLTDDNSSDKLEDNYGNELNDEYDIYRDRITQQLQTKLICSLFSDVFSIAITYPLETVLIRLHTQGMRTIIDNTDNGIEVVPLTTTYNGFFDCFHHIYSIEGISAFYKGFGALLIKSALQYAFIKLSCAIVEWSADQMAEKFALRQSIKLSKSNDANVPTIPSNKQQQQQQQ